MEGDNEKDKSYHVRRWDYLMAKKEQIEEWQIQRKWIMFY